MRAGSAEALAFLAGELRLAAGRCARVQVATAGLSGAAGAPDAALCAELQGLDVLTQHIEALAAVAAACGERGLGLDEALADVTLGEIRGRREARGRALERVAPGEVELF